MENKNEVEIKCESAGLVFSEKYKHIVAEVSYVSRDEEDYSIRFSVDVVLHDIDIKVSDIPALAIAKANEMVKAAQLAAQT